MILFLTILSFSSLGAGVINLPGLSAPEWPRSAAAGIMTINEEGLSGDGLEYRRVWSFDEEGKLLTETFFDSEEKQGSQISYIYDRDGRLVLKEFHHPDALVADHEEYVWDETGRLFSVARIYTTGKYGWRFEYSYDEEDRLIFVTKIDRYWKDVVVWRKSFSYDEAGRITASEGGGLDENIHWYDEYAYDEGGRLVSQEKYDVNHELVSRTLLTYAEEGQVIREEYLNGNLELVRRVDFYYRLNEEGFWIEKQIGEIEYSGAGSYFKPLSRYRRIYTYRSGE